MMTAGDWYLCIVETKFEADRSIQAKKAAEDLEREMEERRRQREERRKAREAELNQ